MHAALWDENAFYFYIEVNDTEHNFDGNVSWGDGAEIYFDPLDTDVNDYSTDDVVYFGFKADDVDNTSFTGTDAGIEAFQNCYKLVSVVPKPVSYMKLPSLSKPSTAESI